MKNERRKILRVLIGALSAAPLRAAGLVGSPSLADAAHQLLLARHAGALKRYLADWPAPASARRSVAPSSVPVVRYLPELAERAQPFCAPFARAVWAAAGTLAWRQSYTSAQVGETFLQYYGWAEIIGLSGETPSEHLACGVLLLGPKTAYPLHRHEAEEVYVPLVGRALWQRGYGRLRPEEEGRIIHHDPFEPHAMRTLAAPLLALYLWRSRNLAQKSQLVPAAE